MENQQAVFWSTSGATEQICKDNVNQFFVMQFSYSCYSCASKTLSCFTALQPKMASAPVLNYSGISHDDMMSAPVLPVLTKCSLIQ